MKKISILGSTGSIGLMTLDVVDNLGDYKVEALSINSNIDMLIQQIKKYRPSIVCIYDDKSYKKFILENKNLMVEYNINVVSGDDGLVEVATLDAIDIVLVSVVGAVGLLPILSAIRKGKKIAIANKEPLVVAGKFLIEESRKNNAQILPVDSEHSAIFQCLRGESSDHIHKLMITASGGPFYKYPSSDLEKVNVDDALRHPRWKMGAKITIDSSTLMNKGFEVIEAHHLFGVSYDDIDVVIHPESIVHSMVEFKDKSILAHLGPTDMRIPIQFALTYPDRRDTNLASLDFTKLASLHFDIPDLNKFPCLGMAIEAGRAGGALPVVLNAANEIAVQYFLDGKIKFLDIARIVDKMLNEFSLAKINSIDDILLLDNEIRTKTQEVLI